GFLAGWLASQAPSLGVWTLPLSFVAIFIVSHLMLGAFADAVIHAVPPRLHGAGSNRVLGVIPGFATGLINATVLALIVLILPRSGGMSILALDSAIAD